VVCGVRCGMRMLDADGMCVGHGIFMNIWIKMNVNVNPYSYSYFSWFWDHQFVCNVHKK